MSNVVRKRRRTRTKVGNAPTTKDSGGGPSKSCNGDFTNNALRTFQTIQDAAARASDWNRVDIVSKWRDKDMARVAEVITSLGKYIYAGPIYRFHIESEVGPWFGRSDM
jgi:hypothetical protein